ncbi:MAG: hypothetical protein HY744_06900, partial [Deltaproteobacteria bacterium]|nr:hypothetical protein [Deltaproteobacteria bacterium]
MSSDKVTGALAVLERDPDDAQAWDQLEDAVTEPGDEEADIGSLLREARKAHEQKRDWWAVARLLEFEIAAADDPAHTLEAHLELGRVYLDELVEARLAAETYERALEIDPENEAAQAAIAAERTAREGWQELCSRYLAEAAQKEDPALHSRLLTSAAEAAYRYGERDEKSLAQVLSHLDRALGLNAASHRAANLAELVYRHVEDWDGLAKVLGSRMAAAPTREDRVAAAHRLARTHLAKRRDEAAAVQTYQDLLDFAPTDGAALSFLVNHYSEHEQWDELAALYEDQLESGAVRPDEELGVWVQLAMLSWKARKQPEAAERYFEKVRRADPAHAGMLRFFREQCSARGDHARLTSILTDAQRALPDGDEKRAFAQEIATLCEGQENARHAIEQYKAVLRSDPESQEARTALRRLYRQTESYGALGELLRQELGRLPENDKPGRIAVLREIVEIHEVHVKSDTALLTVLTQILQLDAADLVAQRALCRVYESLGRWRDLLGAQQKLVALSDSKAEKVALLRSMARRWTEQFSNVQNALEAYEALSELSPGDPEALDALRELYKKRRAWNKLFALYEGELGEAKGERQRELCLEMAQLCAERLGQGERAIALLKQALALGPGATEVLDAIERQAERQKDFATVAEVLEKRVELARDDKDKLALLQKLGVLLSDRVEDHEAASRAWRRVLDLSPGHKRALRVLRQSFVAAADWDGLAELYGSQDDWEGLADFLSTTADRLEDVPQKLELSFRAARVYEEKLGAPERAVRSYERVLGIDPGSVRSATALLPLYENEEKWSRLPGLHAVLLEAAADVDEKIAILHKMAEISGGPLANKAAALGYARKAYELRPDDQGLKRLEAWSRQSGEWQALIEVVQTRLEALDDDGAPARELRHMLARIYAEEVEKIDEAVRMYRGLIEVDPSDAAMGAELEALLRAADRRDDLRWLFGVKSEHLQGEARLRSIEDWASVEEEVFGEPEQAVVLLRRVVQAAPARASALASLTRLLLGAKDYAGAAEVMRAHRDAVQGELRAELELGVAELSLEHLGEPQEALDACVRALDIIPNHEPAVGLLVQLLEPAPTRHEAAAVLERIYGETNRPREQAQALRALLEAERDAARRLELCQRLAEVHHRKLSEAGTAFEIVLGALREHPRHLGLWDSAAALGAAAGRPTDLAEAFRSHLVRPEPEGELEPGIPAELEVELCERAAALHEEQLGDAEGAVVYLQRVLRIEPGREAAFERLKRILTALERWEDLAALYEEALGRAAGPEARIELLLQMAAVAEDLEDDEGKATLDYERVLELDGRHERATAALERLYEQQQLFDKLAGLLEGQIEAPHDEKAVPLRLRLVDLYLHKLGRPEAVMAHLAAVLRVADDERRARELCEECLQVESLRQPVAALLDTVYEAHDDIRDLARVLDIRLEGAASDAQKRELLRRLSTLRDERLRDDAGAFEALRSLVPLEPEDAAARERLIAIGRRLRQYSRLVDALIDASDACPLAPTGGEILMDAAAILKGELEDPERAEKVFRKVLGVDPDDPALVIPAARALSAIYEEREAHAELAEVLGLEVRLVQEPAERRALYARIALLYEDVLEEDEKATLAWKARLEDDPADGEALAALERLYERGEKWRDLCDVLHRSEERAEDGDERWRCMVKAAEVLSDELGETAEAIHAWRRVVDDFGPEPDILAALGKLYKQAERWEDLAEVIDLWLSLAKEEPEEQEEADQKEADEVELYCELGDVRREHLNDPEGALAAYREVLSRDPQSERCRSALEAMLDAAEPHVRRAAAEAIRPLYEADEDAARLLKVIDIEIESSFEPAAKLRALEAALRIAEQTLKEPGRGFDYAAAGVREAVGEPELTQWIERAERLATAAERQEALLALYEQVAGEILDADAQQNARLRAGELARSVAKDEARATQHYRKALEARSDDRRALCALEELYEGAQDAPSLLEILRLRVEASEDDADRVDLLFRVAELLAGPLGKRDEAIRTYQDIIDLSVEPDAVAALEGLYRQAGRFGDLVQLYERQLDEAPDGAAAAAIRVKIAQVAHAELRDEARALDELGEALGQDAGCEAAVTALELVLEKAKESEHRALAAELLEPVYLRTAHWEKLRHVFEARLETSPDPGERAEVLRQLATLCEEQLEDYAAAIETYGKLLHDEPGDEEIAGEIERLARVLGDDSQRRVAEIYAAALAEGGAACAGTAKLCRRTGELFAGVGAKEQALQWYRRAHELSPGSKECRLLAKREQSRGQAIDQLEDIVRELPEHREAITELEGFLADDARQERAIELLRPLYEGAGDWRGQLRLLDLQLEHVDEPADQVELLREMAAIWEKSGESPERAFEVARRAFRLVPEDAASRELLERLAEQLGAWEELGDSIEKAAGAVQDEIVRAELWDALSEVADECLDDPRRALRALGKLAELRPEEPEPLGRMDTLCTLLGDWPSLLDVLRRQTELSADDAVTAELVRRKGSVRADMLEDLRGAVQEYERALELEPESTDSVDCLIALYERLDEPQRLVDLYDRRAELAGADEEELRHALMLRAAQTHEQRLGNPDEAMRLLAQALAVRPDDREVLRALERLYRAGERHEDLLDNLEMQAELAPSGPERAETRNKLGDLLAAQLDHAADALDQYRLVLEDAPADAHAIASVRALAEKHEELRLDVAKLLEPVLSQAGRFEELVSVLEMRLSAQTDPAERADTLGAMALLLEEQLERPPAARDALLRALAETPDDEELHGDIERLCELCEDYGSYADALEKRAGAEPDAELAAALHTRLGEIAEEKLGAPERAIAAFGRALEEEGDRPYLLEALDRLYERTKNAQALAGVLSQRVEIEQNEASRAELGYRLAVLRIDEFGDKAAGLDALRDVVELVPGHKEARAKLEALTGEAELFERAAEALETVYRAEGDNVAVARLSEKRISKAPTVEERVRLRLELARMLEDRASDTRAAQEVVEKAFADNPGNEDLLGELERLATANAAGSDGPAAWRRAA